MVFSLTPNSKSIKITCLLLDHIKQFQIFSDFNFNTTFTHVKNTFIAVMEFKSQVGSFGNNFNNG